MISSIIFAEEFVCSANFWISLATTANPFPALPALAASILAFNDNKFVWLAICAIKFTTSWIFTTEEFVLCICSDIFINASVVLSLVLPNSFTILAASVPFSLIPFEVIDKSLTLSLICIIFLRILDTCCEETDTSSACVTAPFAISSKAALTISAAPFVRFALSSNLSPASARCAAICCKW